MHPISLLVSPRSLEGARQAIAGDADIIDCKNPDEGSLGANFPWVIKDMKGAIVRSGKRNVQLSATIGDMPDLPGTASLAATGVASLEVDYVKVGVFGPKTSDRATALLKAVVKATKDVNNNISVVAAGYADYTRINTSIPPLQLVEIALETGCDVVMVDTAIKDDQIHEFCDKAKSSGLVVALAGRLQMDHIAFIKTTRVDIIGVRSLVIDGIDRKRGVIDASRVLALKQALFS
nr:(5-formylfuran-3-yl)methyl phosphate synthase [Candidatus Sigynarchaeota archaeon]